MKKINRIIFRVAFLLILFVAGGYFYQRYIKVDTKYAPGYSEAIFKKIKVGMSENQVLQLLGEPLEQNFQVTYKGEEGNLWIYAEQGEDKTANYEYRTIRFNLSGEVVEKFSAFDFD